MRNLPVWIDDTPIQKFPKLQRNINADVLIVGAGVIGMTIGYLLKKSGLRVALIERERVASIDTGHTTAHLTCVTDVQLRDLVRNFGKDHAQAAWDIGAAAINEIVGRHEKKPAAFRDSNGNVHPLSPVCAHLGCLVRWNPSESTWDCPCHGSRFKPTGEVIAGPAEEPLPSI